MKFLKSKGYIIKSFLLFVLILFVTVFFSRIFLEPFMYNFFVKNATSNSKMGSDGIVIVAIDDVSISYHRWPWPREMYGEIFNYFNDYANPKVLGFDAVIQSSDKDNPKSDKKFFEAIAKTKNLVVGFSPQYLYEEDYIDSNYIKDFEDKFSLKINNLNNLYKDAPKLFNNIQNMPAPYFNSVNMAGSIYTPANEYGYVTTMGEIVAINDKYYPSLGLKMYMHLKNANSISLYREYFEIDDINESIPAFHSNGEVWKANIRYYNYYNNTEYTHKTYHASDIIRSYRNLREGKKPIIDPKEFDGKIVFIGANAKTAEIGLEDVRRTPLLDNHPGVDIQATNLDNLLNHDFMNLSSDLVDNIIILLFAFITFILISKYSIIKAITANVLIAALYSWVVVYCYFNTFAIPAITPIVVQIITTIFGYSYKFIVEGRNKEKIKQAMGKYLSQDVMQNVVQNIDDIKLGGKRAIVTVLFSDIRGFTSMSEKMSAEDVSKILNEYFTEMEPIITKYNGVINKFIGDAVMAIFGEPIQDLDHPINAVLCAYEMLKKVEELQERWLFEGKPKIEIGVGINTGECFVGNIGSEKRLEYTVIGDTVNLASRIEHYNKVYHTNLLVSSSTYSYIASIADVIKISEVTIRGKSKKMDIYEVLRINKKQDDDV